MQRVFKQCDYCGRIAGYKPLGWERLELSSGAFADRCNTCQTQKARQPLPGAKLHALLADGVRQWVRQRFGV